ncbi:ABC transporter permease [Bordetella avium]|uniref:O-antigen export ABC transporter,putative permease protein n=2 Tax=Bordetella avium TaxID=521 RepID=Q2KUG3_BORA1|nr:ABC transporter permease [Bordetella avium]WQE33915.1 ABC transporter permease [Bordetella avium]CAJ50697.1 putative O-antigen export ABC transporter,putative permease protein [Bordetella avium 197N]
MSSRSLRYMCNALRLSVSDVRTRYRKSVLGPLWLTLGNAVAIFGFSAVWAELLGEKRNVFIPSLAIGLVIWQYLSGVMASATVAYTANGHVMRNHRIPVWFFAVRTLGYHLINLAHNLALVCVVLFFFGTRWSDQAWLAIPGLLLLIFASVPLAALLAALGARFRDVRYAVESSLPLLFFVSPVLFRPESLAGRFIWFNPVSYFIEALRMPLMSLVQDQAPPQAFIYAGALGFFLILCLACAAVYARNPRRVLFWI